MNREVITLQVGHYANFVGAHWWNMQQASMVYTKGKDHDINHNVMFRAGLNLQEEVTFTPRLVVVDTKSTLYNDDCTETIPWNCPVNIIQKEPVSKPHGKVCWQTSQAGPSHSTASAHTEAASVDMDNYVSSWSDFIEVKLHPRSICRMNESTGFGDHEKGDGLEESIIEDRLRQYAEECDQLQGFQILMDGDNEFSAISSCIIYHLDDEYKKKTSIAFPLYQNNSRRLLAADH